MHEKKLQQQHHLDPPFSFLTEIKILRMIKKKLDYNKIYIFVLKMVKNLDRIETFPLG